MQEQSIFIEALDKEDPVERAAFLDQVCAGDSALRQRIDRLLRRHQQADGFLESAASAPDATADEPVSERPGTVIGPYKLLEQIGEGGFGVVFMAEQSRPVRRKVALKVLKPGMDTRQVVARFEAERQALALMDHPNIAHVFDGGETDSGRPYFVMELVRGIPITEFCDQGNLSVRERLVLFVTVCQAVQHAHQKGIIHRDLKPANIMVTMHDATAVAKVIDFGIAKATGQQLTDKTLFTNFAQLVGTPLYMSPEQAQMCGLDVDTRSDIYSLGVLLYELLTGTTPFDRERLKTVGYDEIRRIIREEEPPKPSTRLSTLGLAAATASAHRRSDPKQLGQLMRGELDWIVMKALDKDRNRRYETASAFAADVQRYLRDEPVLACPPSAGYRCRKFMRRYKGPVLAASVVVLALLGGIIGTTWGMLRADDAEAAALQEAGLKEVALEAAQASERDAKEKLFLALLNQARAGRFSEQMGQRLDSLDALAKAARIRPDERLRDEAIAAMALPDIRRGPKWQAWPPGYHLMAFDGNYKLFARANDQTGISLRSVPDDRELWTINTTPSTFVHIELSPDGRFLVGYEEGSTLGVWNVASGKLVLRVQRQHPGWGAAFSADSRMLALAQENSVLRIDLTTGRELNRWRLAGTAQAHCLAFHRDNRHLAVGYYYTKTTSVYDATNGSLIADLPVGLIQEQVVAWHPDGERLAVAGSDPRIQIWDVAAKRKLATLEGHLQVVTALSFHPDGDLLASTSHDGVLRLWDPSTGRQLMQLPLMVYPRISDDGRWLGVAQHGEEAQLLEVVPTREYRTLVGSLGPGAAHGDGDISPDGRLLALDRGRTGVHVWHLASGREVAQLPPGIPLFQPDERELLTCDRAGIHRWAIQDNGNPAEAIRLGPPRTIPLPIVPHRAGRTQDGRTLAIVDEMAGTGVLVDLSTETVRKPFLEHPNAGFVAVSRDGQWMASSGWHASQVRLWNTGTGKVVREWPGGRATVAFTPDNRALVIGAGDEFSFWNVETLQPSLRIRRDVALYPGNVAFSPDGRLMALEMAPGVIHLKEVATGQTVAKLDDPHDDRAGWMAFTPDGTQLVVAAAYVEARYVPGIHIWDLRAIRQRLKTMGLNWDWPEFPLAPAMSRSADTPKVEVLLGNLAKPELTREQRARQAIESYRHAVGRNPNDAQACNNLAWAYLTAPEGLRNNKAALHLVEKAVRLAGKHPACLNTLALAYYRAGKYREAVATLRPSLQTEDDAFLAYDLYFLAMSHHRLGETDQARTYYDWAVRWVRTQPNLAAAYVEELTIFRAEAEELLGIDRKKD